MYHLLRQNKFFNMSVYIPKSDEIDWDLLIFDENERNLTKDVYENIEFIEDYKANHPDIPEKIYKKAESILQYGVKDKYLIYEKPDIFEELFASDNMTHVIFIACGLLFFYGKIFIDNYL
jgi:hypothetical protein